MILDLSWQTFEPEGFGLSIELKPLSFEAFQIAMRIASTLASTSLDAKADVMALISQETTLEAAKAIYPDHVKNLKGITIKESFSEREATVEHLTQFGAFSTLNVIIIGKLIEISALTEGDKKKSEKAQQE